MNGSTLLDTLQITSPKEQRLKQERALLANKYFEDGDYKKSSRIARCGEPTPMLCTHCGTKHLFSYRCGLRTCSSCAAARARQMTMQYKKIMASTVRMQRGWRTKMITFTVPTKGDYAGAVARINKGMISIWENHLRRDAMGRKIKSKKKGVKVASGMISALEFGPKTGNVHVHCLYYGPYIPRGDVYQLPDGKRVESGRKGGPSSSDLQALGAKMIEKGLVSEWKDETGAYIVDVRPADKNSLNEVCKYLTKPSGVSPAHHVEYERVVAGTRRFKTYGVYFNPEFEARADEKDMKGKECPTCETRGSLIFDENFNSYIDRLFKGKTGT